MGVCEVGPSRMPRAEIEGIVEIEGFGDTTGGNIVEG